jgi:hypothetical protein
MSATGVRPQGLVICPKTGNDHATVVDVPDLDRELAQLTGYQPSFPSRAEVAGAVAQFGREPAWHGQEGPRARIVVAPGMVGVTRRDRARRDRTDERAATAHPKAVDQLAQALLRDGEFPDPPAPTREVTHWSRKSRANMHKAFRELDMSQIMVADRPPAMVTLTYPGEWQVVAPTGAAAKKHLHTLRRLYLYAWGHSCTGFWKLEFQDRGAPHFHLLMCPPQGKARRGTGTGLTFKHWLSLVWAKVVNHPDAVQYARHVSAGTNVNFAEGLRYRDPQRAVTYFAKHGDYAGKEYQHVVPVLWQAPGAGPGRFWGYWKMERVPQAVEVSPRRATWAARILRRLSRALGVTRQARVPRYDGGRVVPTDQQQVEQPAPAAPIVAQVVTGLAGAQLVEAGGRKRFRKLRRRAVRLTNGAGWLSTNHGPRLAEQLARAVESLVPQREMRFA